MERKHLSTVARQFKRSFSQQVLNGPGKAVRFCFRVRAITPYRLALGLIEVFATMQVKTIADVHRAFNALCNTTVHYKPFHNQLVKATFPTFMRGLCEQLMARLTSEVLRSAPQSPFAQFTHITIHDGTSFAVKSTLKSNLSRAVHQDQPRGSGTAREHGTLERGVGDGDPDPRQRIRSASRSRPEYDERRVVPRRPDVLHQSLSG